MKILNLYAGLGGNRKNWKGVKVTAVESNPEIAAIYQRLNPDDEVIIGDAHAYLLANHHKYDFVWSSPPCQSHSRMMKATRHDVRKYPDMKLYEEIIFLQNFFKGQWIVENVVPYYKPLIDAQKIGRHLFWSNYLILAEDVKRPSGFINKSNKEGKRALQDWLGIHFEETIYYDGNHCPAQILRNCVHPDLGEQVYNCASKTKQTHPCA